MKYSETPLLTAGDLHGTELICALDRNGVTKVVTTAALKVFFPEQPDSGLLLDNPKTATGYRLDTSSSASGSGFLLSLPNSTTGYRLADPTGEIPEATPVETPTITAWQTSSPTSMYLAWTDNQINPSDAFVINVSTNGQPVTGSPFRVENTGGSVSNYTITGLQPSTSYTAQMLAEAAGDQSAPTAPVTASTQSDQTGPFDPEYYRDFEGGALGADAAGPSAFDNISGYETVFSDTHVYTGTRSAEMIVGNNAVATGNPWGGNLPYMANLCTQGESTWCRVLEYFPPGFDFYQKVASGTKGLRLYQRNNGSDGYGNWGLAIAPGGVNSNNGLCVTCSCTGNANFVGDPQYDQVFKEFHNVWNSNAEEYSVGPSLVTGRWYGIEMQVKWSAHYDGIIRCWLHSNEDGSQLVYERTGLRTVGFNNAVSGKLQIHSHWNDFIRPAVQSAWIDNMCVTKQTPPNTDSNGNACIGMWTR